MTASHKFNKNTFVRPNYSSATTTSSFITASEYDNAYIQHPIPRSDYQYTWITSSVYHDNRIQLAGNNGYALSKDWLDGNWVSSSVLQDTHVVYPNADLLSGSNITIVDLFERWNSTNIGATIDRTDAKFGAPLTSSNGGLLFDGTSQYVSLNGDVTNFSATTSTGIFSFGFKIKTDSFADNKVFFSTFNDQQTHRPHVYFEIDSNILKFRFVGYNGYSGELDLEDNQTLYSSDLSSYNGQEIEVIVVADGISMYLYVEGSLEDTILIDENLLLNSVTEDHANPGVIGAHGTYNDGDVVLFYDGEVNGFIYSELLLDTSTISDRLTPNISANLTELDIAIPDLDLLSGSQLTASAPPAADDWNSTDALASISGLDSVRANLSSNGGLSFDGSTYRASISGVNTNFEATTTTGLFCFAFRIKPILDATQRTIFSNKVAGSAGVEIYIDALSNLVADFLDNSGAVLWNNSVSVSSYSGIEFDVIIIGDGSNSYLYLDGATTPDDTAAITTSVDTHGDPGWIGVDANTLSFHFQGDINSFIYVAEQIDRQSVYNRLWGTGDNYLHFIADTNSIPKLDLLANNGIDTFEGVSTWNSEEILSEIDVVNGGGALPSVNGGLEFDGSINYARFGGTYSNFVETTNSQIYSLGIRLKINTLSKDSIVFSTANASVSNSYIKISLIPTFNLLSYTIRTVDFSKTIDIDIDPFVGGSEFYFAAISNGNVVKFYINSILVHEEDVVFGFTSSASHGDTGIVGANFDGEVNSFVYYEREVDLADLIHKMQNSTSLNFYIDMEATNTVNATFNPDVTNYNKSLKENLVSGYNIQDFQIQYSINKNNYLQIYDYYAPIANAATRTAFGGSSWDMWNQVRGGEHPITLKLKKDSSINYVKEENIGEDRVVKNNVSVVEPCLLTKYKPLKIGTHFSFDPTTNKVDPLVFSYNHNNKGKVFANKNLYSIFNIDRSPQTTYDSIIEDYLYNGPNSAIKSFNYLEYSETIWPRSENTYLSIVRDRPNYYFNWRTKRQDRTFIYDNNYSTHYWGGQVEVLNANYYVKPNSQGNLVMTGSIWPLDSRKDYDDTLLFKPGMNYHPGGVGELNSVSSVFHNGDYTILSASALFSMPSWDIGTASNDIAFTNDTEFSVGQPFADSYDEWNELVRVKGKDYSIIPEFNISEHMDFYLNEVGGDFLANLDNTFTVTGSKVSSYLEDSFFQIYSSTELLEEFGDLREKHSNIATPKTLQLKAKALMKFTPREGFYPIERSLQLASLFSQSYGDNSVLTGEGAYWGQTLRPFYAPGIIYNSMKAGLSVDYPIFNRSVLYGSTDEIFPGVPQLTPYTDGEFGVKRLPFESIIEPSSYINGTWVDEQTHPSGSVDSTSSLGSFKLNHSLAVSNFLASSIDFFNKNSKLTTLVSKPDSEGLVMELGKEYRMRVYLRSSEVFNEIDIFKNMATSDSINTLLSDNGITGVSGDDYILPLAVCSELLEKSTSFSNPTFKPTGRYNFNNSVVSSSASTIFTASYHHEGSSYGVAYTTRPPEQIKVNSNSFSGIVDYNSTYASYSPPYMEGFCYVDYVFRPFDEQGNVFYSPTGEKRKFTYDDILNNITSSYYRFSETPAYDYYISQDITNLTSSTGVQIFGQSSQKNIVDLKMQIDSVLSLDATIENKKAIYDEEGYVKSFEQDLNIGKSWAIYPKWESPIFNYDNLEDQTLPAYHCNIETGYGRQFGNHYNNSSRGLFMQIADYPNSYFNFENTSGTNYSATIVQTNTTLTSSLADIVGFKKQPLRLGEIQDKKVIEEAIVAIPFYQFDQTRSFVKILQPTQENPSSVSVQFNKALQGDATTTILRQIEAMKKYVIPPQLDFVTNGVDKVEPLAMYFFEFKYELTKDDLRNIWQNISPQAKMQESEVTISEEIGANGLLKDIENDKIQWLIFKVKKKGEWNYFKKTIDSKDDNRFQQLLVRGSINDIPDYSYNWPYDFCSVVEMAKIEAKIVLESEEQTELRTQGKKATRKLMEQEPPKENKKGIYGLPKK